MTLPEEDIPVVPVESLGEAVESGEEHIKEKYIHLRLVGDEAIPTSAVDFELLRKFTGLTRACSHYDVIIVGNGDHREAVRKDSRYPARPARQRESS